MGCVHEDNCSDIMAVSLLAQFILFVTMYNVTFISINGSDGNLWANWGSL